MNPGRSVDNEETFAHGRQYFNFLVTGKLNKTLAGGPPRLKTSGVFGVVIALFAASQDGKAYQQKRIRRSECKFWPRLGKPHSGLGKGTSEGPHLRSIQSRVCLPKPKASVQTVVYSVVVLNPLPLLNCEFGSGDQAISIEST